LLELAGVSRGQASSELHHGRAAGAVHHPRRVTNPGAILQADGQVTYFCSGHCLERYGDRALV
jgi:hypothetical protein